MSAGGTISLKPSFRIWVLVLVLLFLALCGLHLLGVHHEGGHSPAVGLAIVMVAILLFVLTNRQTIVQSLAQRPLSCSGYLIVAKPRVIRPIRAPLRV